MLVCLITDLLMSSTVLDKKVKSTTLNYVNLFEY